MERLKQLIQAERSGKARTTDVHLLNLVREYLQVLVLKIMFQHKAGAALSFMGGTCLRICYDFKRYSEDLDFSLDAPQRPYDFARLMQQVQTTLEHRGFTVDLTHHDEKIVQKAFFRFQEFQQMLHLRQFRTEQKLHIKIEVDVQPPPVDEDDRESFFVTRFQEIFPILKHTLSTLFAGKLLAIFDRPYARGRDYYDLMWYLSQKTPINLPYLNRAVKRQPFVSETDVFAALTEKIRAVNPALILKDIDRFLEDPSEVTWIRHYEQLFSQLVAGR
ncbi:MAG: nucleotidyl transferase AbiEii/AbiGii toxin family protein [Deltaproteobacteria bacterium]|nr:nucleotidyl transferase AbiEii/AbiGii toxin family protein [Deltaproteobacteria bacterium]